MTRWTSNGGAAPWAPCTAACASSCTPGWPGSIPVPGIAEHLGLEPWLRPAVQDAIAATRRLVVTDQLTYGVLHGEPEAANFRIDPGTGRVGLVGWAGAGTGPLVYDVASAVLVAGGPSAAARPDRRLPARGPVPPEECEVALPVLLRMRAAELAHRAAARIYAGGVPLGTTRCSGRPQVAVALTQVSGAPVLVEDEA